MAFRFGLLGFGRWGQQLLATISGMANVRVTEVCTRNPERARLVPPSVVVRRDWHDVIRSPATDAVIIATPPAFHAAHLLACLDERKPAIVEKPLCLDSATAKTVQRRVARARTRVLVDHTLLFNPAFEKLRDLTSGREHIRAVVSEGRNYGPFRSDANALWDWSPHDVACCLDLIGRLPSHVAALGGIRAPGKAARPQLLALRLDFRGGPTAWIESGSLSLRRRRSVSVFTDRQAMIFSDAQPSTLEVFRVEWQGRRQRDTGFRLPAPSRVFEMQERPLERMITYFVKGIDGRGDQSRFGVALAVDVVRVLEMADRAL